MIIWHLIYNAVDSKETDPSMNIRHTSEKLCENIITNKLLTDFEERCN